MSLSTRLLFLGHFAFWTDTRSSKCRFSDTPCMTLTCLLCFCAAAIVLCCCAPRRPFTCTGSACASPDLFHSHFLFLSLSLSASLYLSFSRFFVSFVLSVSLCFSISRPSLSLSVHVVSPSRSPSLSFARHTRSRGKLSFGTRVRWAHGFLCTCVRSAHAAPGDVESTAAVAEPLWNMFENAIGGNVSPSHFVYSREY